MKHRPPGTRHPTTRFSDRVERYIQYRPAYPPAVIDLLRHQCDLTPSRVVADLGSGTGLFAKLFLENGNRVHGIEPNAEMREAAERLLRHNPRFASRAGTAEKTGLPDRTIDLAAAGQAFHWFDAAATKAELRRILRPPGWVVLVWNERRNDNELMAAYETLLKSHCPEYDAVDHHRLDVAGLDLFAEGEMRVTAFDNHQAFDYPGLEGRVLSSSYAPLAGQPGHRALLGGLARLFERYSHGGTVRFIYDTRVYYGRLLG